MVTNVRSRWVNGDLIFYDKTETEVAHFGGFDSLFFAMGGVRTVRKRFTIAQINAGATILAAIAGYKYRAVDCYAIAYGGAVAATTTVDVLGTLSTAQKIVAFGQAALTQSTLVRAGASGGVILADGASFVAMDANTAITIGKTGSDLTTATGVDVVFTYTIEA